MCPPLAAPSAPPRAVSVAGNGTSVHISWQPPPLAEQNGVIRDYRVSVVSSRDVASPLCPPMTPCHGIPMGVPHLFLLFPTRFGAWAMRAASTSTRAWRGRCWRQCCGDWSPGSLTVLKLLLPPVLAWVPAVPLSPSASVSLSLSQLAPTGGAGWGHPRQGWGWLLGTLPACPSFPCHLQPPWWSGTRGQQAGAAWLSIWQRWPGSQPSLPAWVVLAGSFSLPLLLGSTAAAGGRRSSATSPVQGGATPGGTPHPSPLTHQPPTVPLFTASFAYTPTGKPVSAAGSQYGLSLPSPPSLSTVSFPAPVRSNPR